MGAWDLSHLTAYVYSVTVSLITRALYPMGKIVCDSTALKQMSNSGHRIAATEVPFLSL